MKNKLGASATQQELLKGLGVIIRGSQWNEQGNWGVTNPTTPVNSNPDEYNTRHKLYIHQAYCRTLKQKNTLQFQGPKVWNSSSGVASPKKWGAEPYFFAGEQ